MRPARLTLATQILVFQVLILTAALGLGLALALHATRAQLDAEFQQRALAVARSVAATPEVVRGIQDGAPGGVVQVRAERVRRASRASFVVVTDRRGIRFSHPEPDRLGKRVSTDPSAALAGRTVLAVETGSLGRSARAKVPLRAGGRVVGEVSVGCLEPAVRRRLAELLPALLLYSGASLAFGVVASLGLARRLKRQTYGLELPELTGLLREREAMLHGIREGVIAMDDRGLVRLVNDEARRLLGFEAEAPVGLPVGASVAPGRLADVLEGRSGGDDVLLVHDERILVANRMPVRRDGRTLGTIVTLRDRTELEALTRELDSVRGLTDALRAQAHEFANRMHTLSGLLALDHVAAARTFLSEVASADGALRDALVERVEDERVGALLLAKSVVAAERGVALRLAPGTRLEAALVDGREVLTVVGNLVENAIESAARSARRPAVVEVLLRQDGPALDVVVTDSGDGVAPADRDAVFEAGWTTKHDDGHGVGLSLVEQLTRRRGGVAHVGVADELGGAEFSVRLPDALRQPAAAR